MEKRFEPLIQDQNGDTALHLAAVYGCPMSCFNLTKAAPAACLSKNLKHQRPAEVAKACERGEVAPTACCLHPLERSHLPQMHMHNICRHVTCKHSNAETSTLQQSNTKSTTSTRCDQARHSRKAYHSACMHVLACTVSASQARADDAWQALLQSAITQASLGLLIPQQCACRLQVLNAMLLACSGDAGKTAVEAMEYLLQEGAVPDTWAPNGSSVSSPSAFDGVATKLSHAHWLSKMIAIFLELIATYRPTNRPYIQ